MTLDPFAPALVPILGQPLQAGMDQPFLAGSIREFWGCRWVFRPGMQGTRCALM